MGEKYEKTDPKYRSGIPDSHGMQKRTCTG